MPFCMNCRHEYAEGVKTCPDCGLALVDESQVSHGLPAPQVGAQSPSAYAPALVGEFEDPVELELVESQLRSAGIPNVRRPQLIALFVPASFRERALQIMQGGEEAGPEGEVVEEEDTLSLSELHRIRLVCSDCGHETTVDLLDERVPPTCPNCGHRFDIGSALPVLDRYADVMRMLANADFEIEVEKPQGEG